MKNKTTSPVILLIVFFAQQMQTQSKLPNLLSSKKN